MAEAKGFKDRLSGTTYDLKDATAREGVATNAEAIAALAETVTTYNGYCEAGEDAEFGKPASDLVKIGEGPYYAIKMASYAYNTVAGLDIDAQFRVLNTEGQPIKGLYALGNDSAGVLFMDAVHSQTEFTVELVDMYAIS